MQMSTPKYAEYRRFIHNLDKGKCHICRKPVRVEVAVLDHIVPLAAAGMWGIRSSDEYWNIRIAHRGCNAARGAARLPGQLRLHLDV